MKKFEVAETIIHQAKSAQGLATDDVVVLGGQKGLGYAPTNIALCKYWGKRDTELNLPVTPSLSVALPDKGAYTTVTFLDHPQDQVILNGEALPWESPFVKRVVQYLDLFRVNQPWRLKIDIQMNLPVAAGLASSACGFASLIRAMNDLFEWELTPRQLSILARLGSGSAARSIFGGFVEWHEGSQPDGMDSFAEPNPTEWPGLCIGILNISSSEKPVSSRDAMLRTVNSSALYQSWPRKVSQDLALIKQAIHTKNFALMAGTAESNALAMHATMMACWPPVLYSLPETIACMHTIWAARHDGLPLYFTQDAGPNLKLIFMKDHLNDVKSLFSEVEVISLFESDT